MCEIAERIRIEGKQEGIKEGLLASLKNLVKNANMTLEQAISVLEIPEKDRTMYKAGFGFDEKKLA